MGTQPAPVLVLRSPATCRISRMSSSSPTSVFLFAVASGDFIRTPSERCQPLSHVRTPFPSDAPPIRAVCLVGDLIRRAVAVASHDTCQVLFELARSSLCCYLRTSFVPFSYRRESISAATQLMLAAAVRQGCTANNCTTLLLSTSGPAVLTQMKNKFVECRCRCSDLGSAYRGIIYCS